MHPTRKHIAVWFYFVLFIYIGTGAFIGADLHVTLTSKLPTESSLSQYKYKGVVFKSEEVVKEVVKRETVGKYFPWILDLPLTATVLLLAFCSAAFGGIIKIFREIAIDHKDILDIPITYLSFFAGSLGLMVLGVSYLLPAALTASKNTPRPIAIMFLSIFAGIFCENTMEWLEKQNKKLFK